MRTRQHPEERAIAGRKERTLAILDIETAGSSAVYGRIIEIAVLRIEQGKIVRRFHSLVNPERTIPVSIERLTGISNDDLHDAPTFREISRTLLNILSDAIIVAHNARFDYGFLKNEFRNLGRSFTAKTLCTVRLSRMLFPEHRHHDLTSVIRRHELTCPQRHRALDDAMAVHLFLNTLYCGPEAERVEQAVRTILRGGVLPPHVDQTVLEDLPEATGVYLFYGGEGELLYVGKSVNIRARVLSHFSGDHVSGRQMEMCRNVHRIESRRTAGELGALLLESRLIKELQPVYNQASRRKRNLIVARRIINREGYMAIILEEIDHIDLDPDIPIMALFKSGKQAKEFLGRTAKEHRLCLKLLGLERTSGYCFAYHLRQCNGACRAEEPSAIHNARFEEAFAERRVKAWPFPGGIVIEERDGPEAGEVFLIDQWCLVSSFRYADGGYERHLPGNHRFDYDSYRILTRYLFNRTNRGTIRHVPRNEFDTLLNAASESSLTASP
ncbi:MAG: exonuclease domain-containing protein [Ignavibacteria bacterium]|nr:exonuclease domain-containing protein [Ignavibacteria bacterium]